MSNSPSAASSPVAANSRSFPESSNTTAKDMRRCKHCFELVEGDHEARVAHKKKCWARPASSKQQKKPLTSPTKKTSPSPSVRKTRSPLPEDVISNTSSATDPKVAYREKLIKAAEARMARNAKKKVKPFENATVCVYCGKLYRKNSNGKIEHDERECKKSLPAGHRERISQREKAERERRKEAALDAEYARRHRPHTTDPADDNTASEARRRSLYSVASNATPSGLCFSVPAQQMSVTPNITAYDRQMESLVKKTLPPIDTRQKRANEWTRCQYCKKRVVRQMLKQHEAHSCVVGMVVLKLDRLDALVAGAAKLEKIQEESRQADRKAAQDKNVSSERVAELKKRRREDRMRKRAGGSRSPDGTVSTALTSNAGKVTATATEAGTQMLCGLICPPQFSKLPEEEALLEEARQCLAIIDAIVRIRHLYLDSGDQSLNAKARNPRGIEPSMDDISTTQPKLVRVVTEWMENYGKDEDQIRRERGEDDDDASRPRSAEPSPRTKKDKHNPLHAPAITEALHQPKLYRRIDEERKSGAAQKHADFLSRTRTADIMGWEHQQERRELYGDLLPAGMSPTRHSAAVREEEAKKKAEAKKREDKSDDDASSTEEDEAEEESDYSDDFEDDDDQPLIVDGKECKFDEATLLLARQVVDGDIDLGIAVDMATKRARDRRAKSPGKSPSKHKK